MGKAVQGGLGIELPENGTKSRPSRQVSKRAHLLSGDGFDPDRTYIWIEDGSLMEYQGIQEATPGTVSCPLCDGSGEVDEAVAEEYAEAFGDSGASE